MKLKKLVDRPIVLSLDMLIKEIIVKYNLV